MDLLGTLTEISVTVAALSVVAGAIGGGNVGGVGIRLLRDVALIGMFVALFSFVPLILREAGVAEDTALKYCSLAAFLMWSPGYLVYLRSVAGDSEQRNWMFYLGCVLTTVGLVFFTAAFLQYQPLASYLFGLLSWLSIACLNFMVVVFFAATEEIDEPGQ